MLVAEICVGQGNPLIDCHVHYLLRDLLKFRHVRKFGLKLHKLICQPFRQARPVLFRSLGFLFFDVGVPGAPLVFFGLIQPFCKRLVPAALFQYGLIELLVLAIHQGVHHLLYALLVRRRQIPDLVQRWGQLVKFEPLLSQCLRLFERQLPALVVVPYGNHDGLPVVGLHVLLRVSGRCGVRRLPGLVRGFRCCGGCAYGFLLW